MIIPRRRLANLITASRFLLAVLFVLLFPLDTVTAHLLLFITVLAIFISDVIDGTVAKRFGSISPRIEGTVFDIMADNFVIIATSITLFWKGLIPVWLVLLILWTRSLMVFVRLLTAVRGEPFAGPRWSTKAKGTVYGLGLICLVGMYSLDGIYCIPYQALITQIIIAIWTIFTIIAILDFFTANRHTLSGLFKEQ